MKHIDIELLKEKFNEYLIIDLRKTGFNLYHIPNSISRASDEVVSFFTTEVQTYCPICIVCLDGSESKEVAELITRPDVKYLAGGLKQWVLEKCDDEIKVNYSKHECCIDGVCQ